MWPNATDSSHADADVNVGGARFPARKLQSLPLGAPEPTNTASKPPLASRSRYAGDRVVQLQIHAMAVIIAISSSITQPEGGRRECWSASTRRARPYCSKIVTW